jgi:hypothetical protein
MRLVIDPFRMAIDLGQVDFPSRSRSTHGQPAIAHEARRPKRGCTQDAPAGSNLGVPGFDDFASLRNLGLPCFLLAAPLLLTPACLLLFQLASVNAHASMVLPVGTQRYSDQL